MRTVTTNALFAHGADKVRARISVEEGSRKHLESFHPFIYLSLREIKERETERERKRAERSLLR